MGLKPAGPHLRRNVEFGIFSEADPPGIGYSIKRRVHDNTGAGIVV